jgi:hypothetical protein
MVMMMEMKLTLMLLIGSLFVRAYCDLVTPSEESPSLDSIIVSIGRSLLSQLQVHNNSRFNRHCHHHPRE